MGLESTTYISGLVNTNPAANDAKSQGDDHLRLLKSTLLNTFPSITGAVTPTHTELNYVDGVTSAIQTQIDAKGAITGQTWTGTHAFPTQTAADNSTKAATTAYVDTAVTLKANIASPTFTGTPSAPTAATGTSTTQLATTAFVANTAFSSALPAQSGNAGKVLSTDGTNATWIAAGVTLAGEQTLLNKTYTAPKYTRDDDGNISGGTWAIDYANGPVIKATATAGITSITMSNWPASGTAGHLRLMLSAGAYSITFPAWKWIKSDLTTTTTFADLGLTLPSANACIIDLFSDDGGTTMYATVGRN